MSTFSIRPAVPGDEAVILELIRELAAYEHLEHEVVATDALLREWRLANSMAHLPIIDVVIDALVDRGTLIPAENELGAPGCWMSVERA